MSPQLEQTLDFMTAIRALKLKGSPRFVHTSDGVEIHQWGKPVLLLTESAVRDFIVEIEGAST